MRILFFRNYEGFTGGQLKLAQIALRMALPNREADQSTEGL